MLDIYKEREDHASIGEDELVEITVLSGMRNPKIYKRTLSQLIADIDNDTLFDAFKIKLLGAMLLPIAGSPLNFKGDYCSGDDLNSVLRLIVSKLDTILITASNSNLVEMYDSLAIVTTLMAEMKVKGMKGSDKGPLMKKMQGFNDTSMHKMRKIAGFVNEYGENIPMKAKSMYCLEAIKRIGVRREDVINKQDSRTTAVIMGAANLISGIVKMDPDTIQEGLESLGEIALDMYNLKKWEWFSEVSIIDALSYSDFDKFKDQFLNH